MTCYKDLMNDGYFENVDSVMIEFDFLDLELPMAQRFGEKIICLYDYKILILMVTNFMFWIKKNYILCFYNKRMIL